jgi:hypothetical protein
MVRRPWSALPLAALLACSGQPKFLYEADPALRMAAFRTVAFDPRELIWTANGQRPVRTDLVRQQVQALLEGRGLRWVEAGAADLWVNVVAMRPERGGASHGNAKGHSAGQGGGRGGMHGGQGGQGGRDRLSAAGGEAPVPEAPVSRRSGTFDEFDLADDLTITVRLLRREDERRVWVGSVFLPAAGKDQQIGRRNAVAEVVRQLLEPLPR